MRAVAARTVTAERNKAVVPPQQSSAQEAEVLAAELLHACERPLLRHALARLQCKGCLPLADAADSQVGGFRSRHTQIMGYMPSPRLWACRLALYYLIAVHRLEDAQSLPVSVDCSVAEYDVNECLGAGCSAESCRLTGDSCIDTFTLILIRVN